VKEPLRLGVVGCGGIAQFTTWFARWNRGIRLEGCCDIAKERAEAFARRHGIPRSFSCLEKMLDQVEMDAVYVAVPHHLHHPMLMEILDRSMHVLVEKPVTRTLVEGIEVTQRAREQKCKVGVNYQYRYSVACHGLAMALRRHALGEVYYVRIHVPWCRQQSYFDQAVWHRSLEQAGGGTLITQGSHFLDLILWGLGSFSATAMGYTSQARFKDVEVEDLAHGIVQLEDGAFIHIASTMAAYAERPVAVEVFGEKGTALYWNRPWPRVRFRGVSVTRERPPIFGIHALQRSLEGFRAWVKEEKPYLTTAEDALHVLAAVEAIYRSARTGKRERVEKTKNCSAGRP